jgi:proteasome lid subunit RPN8/RPN11
LPLFDFTKGKEQVTGIRKRTLKMILEAGRSSLPNEFGAILRAEEGVINQLWLLPGTESGETAALFRMHMLPVDFSVVGTVHTHPSGSYRPSGADLELFRRFGYVHIIACEPFNMRSWACYDGNGERRGLEVVD